MHQQGEATGATGASFGKRAKAFPVASVVNLLACCLVNRNTLPFRFFKRRNVGTLQPSPCRHPGGTAKPYVGLLDATTREIAAISVSAETDGVGPDL